MAHPLARHVEVDEPATAVALAARLSCLADLLDDAAAQTSALATLVESGEVSTVYARERVRFHLSRILSDGGL